MARFKRGIKRRRSFKRRKSFRRTKSKRFQRGVRRVINQTAEKKALDGNASGTINGVVGTFNFIPNGTAIVQGTGSNQRVGNQIRARSLRISYILQAGNSLVSLPYRITVLVGAFRDYQIVTPDINTFYQYPTSVVAYSPFLREPLQNKEWIPMFQKTYYLARNSSSNTYPEEITRTIKFSGKRLPKKLKTYNAAGFVNWVYFMMIFTSDVVPTAPIHVTNWRLTYTDV